jgi:hypothetical protein
MFMESKIKYCEDSNTTQGDLQIQCNVYQYPKSGFILFVVWFGLVETESTMLS